MRRWGLTTIETPVLLPADAVGVYLDCPVLPADAVSGDRTVLPTDAVTRRGCVLPRNTICRVCHGGRSRGRAQQHRACPNGSCDLAHSAHLATSLKASW